MYTIEHFELPADNIDRAQKFYADMFGWKYQVHQFSDFTYTLIETTNEKGEKGIGGGLISRQHPNQGPIHYIGVPSLDEAVAKVEALGGKLLVPKQTIEGAGAMAICLDTENNTFGLWEEQAKK